MFGLDTIHFQTSSSLRDKGFEWLLLKLCLFTPLITKKEKTFNYLHILLNLQTFHSTIGFLFICYVMSLFDNETERYKMINAI